MYRKYFFIAVFLFTVVISCRKSIETVQSPPPPVDNSSYLQLSFTGIQPSQEAMYAIVSITKENGDSVITNRKVAVTKLNQQYLTEKIKLEKSSYKISKLVVVKTTDTASYAIPLAQSAKATLVSATLPLPVTVSTAGTTPIAMPYYLLLQQNRPHCLVTLLQILVLKHT